MSNTVIQLIKEASKKNDSDNLVEDSTLTENNRKTQPLNGRTVYYFDHISNGSISLNKKNKKEHTDVKAKAHHPQFHSFKD